MIIFISDLHLSPNRPAITQAFSDFLNSTAAKADALYILGDLFDAWVGDDDDTPEFKDVAKALKHYSEQGSSVYFMHGNRDFLLGEKYAASAGVQLIQEPTVIDLPQGKTLLMHGDSLCTRDQDYMALRTRLRNPDWQRDTLQMPLAERKALAAHLRSTSKSMTSLKPEDIMDVTQDEVERVMAEAQCLLLIHGHTHRPARHSITMGNQPAERIVLGDWEDKGWYLMSDEQQLELCSFSIQLN